MSKKNRKNKLTLKWGTLKSWDFSTDKKGSELLQKYCDLGSSMSAGTQHDTPEQKEIICQLIDLCYGKIYLSWDGKFVTKKEAKEYVLNYGKN